MIREKRSFLLALFILSTVFIAASLVPTMTLLPPSSSTQTRPRVLATPPSDSIGNGYDINLADSVNGWQTRSLEANNTYTDCAFRNTTFSQYPPTSFSIAWQNITVLNLRATNDAREIQRATEDPPTTLFQCGTNQPPFKYTALAMSFTPADKVNLTVVRLYYGTTGIPADIPLTIESDNGGKPSGSILGSGTLMGTLGDSWHDIPVSSAGGRPITLTGGVRYWFVMNGSSISAASKFYKWYYAPDPTSPAYDSKLACYYTTAGWKQESDLTLAFNFLAFALVLPVGSDMQPRRYNSPAQVNMYLNTTSQPMSSNTTRIGSSYRTFTLCANTSVTFNVTWTGRFERVQSGGVSTRHIARVGHTLWNATFASGERPPSSPYTWYNRTLRIFPIPQYWVVPSPNPLGNLTNSRSINFTASLIPSSGYLNITQTDDVNNTNIWDANWLLRAKSTYSIAASCPSQVIERIQSRINITTPLWPSQCNITVYNSTGFIVHGMILAIPSSSPYYYYLKLNQSGNYVINLFDRHDIMNEVSLIKLAEITIVPALTLMEPQSSNLKATWGDKITVTFRYRNTTLGSDREFPSLPLVEVHMNDANQTSVSISNLRSLGGGLFSFDLETRYLSSAGTYLLRIKASYEGSYFNEVELTLELNSPGISPIMVMVVGGSSAGAVIAVVAARRYSKGKKLKEEKRTRVLVQTASLAQLIVVDLKSGRSLFSRSLGTEEAVDPNLISGFLSANQAILGEVFKKKAVAGLKSADYGEYKVVSHVGKYVMSTLFCTEAAGEELSSVLEEFTGKFEKKYGKTLESWDGDTDAFKDAEELADELFALPLTAPYMLAEDVITKEKLSGTEKKAVQEARRLSAERGIFFMPRIIDFLLTKEGMKRSATLDVIDSLTKKGVIKQLSVKEAAEGIKNSSRQ